MKSIAMPRSGLQIGQQVEDLRLDRHVERGRRLVGDQQLGVVGQRHRDHHPLALAAGQLVRIRGQPALGLVDPDLLRSSMIARPRLASPRQALMQISRLSASCFSRVCSGFSEVIGS